MTAAVRQTRLSALLAGYAHVSTQQDCEVTALTEDSRYASSGALFFARKGTRHDATKFIPEVLGLEPAGVVFPNSATQWLSVPQDNLYAVDDVAECLGAASDRFYGSPSSQLTMIGVTGTNGKTSIAYYVAQLLDAEPPQASCYMLGTIGVGRPGALEISELTTPDTVKIHSLLANFVSARARYAVMEVSSHALDQQRVAGVHFRIAVLSNLTRDHLDYHGTLETYRAAKRKLFEFAGLSHAVLNADDPFGQVLANSLSSEIDVITYSVQASSAQPSAPGARLVGCLCYQDADTFALQVQLDGVALGEVRAPLIGEFNASNLLAALAVGIACGVSPEALFARAEQIEPALGRMQRIRSGMGAEPAVVVDYAHTPDALSNALRALRDANPDRTLWCVFGCGGDRDRGKRREMARAAERYADHIVLTSDNPRSENPAQIISDVANGFRANDNVIVEEDRRVAIAHAILAAKLDDIVLVAGKGHEDYQEIAGVRYPLSDQQIALGALQERLA